MHNLKALMLIIVEEMSKMNIRYGDKLHGPLYIDWHFLLTQESIWQAYSFHTIMNSVFNLIDSPEVIVTPLTTLQKQSAQFSR